MEGGERVRVLGGLLKAMRRLEEALAVLAFLVLAVSLLVDVAARELTGSGVLGAPQIGVLGMILAAMAGFGLATDQGGHLRPRFADALIPARLEPFFVRVADLLSAAFYVAIAGVSTVVVVEFHDFGDVQSVLRWPLWPFMMILPFAFTLTGVRHLIYAFAQDLRPRDLFTRSEPAPTRVDDI